MWHFDATQRIGGERQPPLDAPRLVDAALGVNGVTSFPVIRCIRSSIACVVTGGDEIHHYGQQRNDPTQSGSAGRLSRSARQQSCRPSRSEEHTSELQSLMRTSYAVFC